jgi:hypothetical protein
LLGPTVDAESIGKIYIIQLPRAFPVGGELSRHTAYGLGTSKLCSTSFQLMHFNLAALHTASTFDGRKNCAIPGFFLSKKPIGFLFWGGSFHQLALDEDFQALVVYALMFDNFKGNFSQLDFCMLSRWLYMLRNRDFFKIGELCDGQCV